MSGTADVAAVVGAAVVVFADPAAPPGAEWKDEAGLALLKRVAGLNQTGADRLRGRVASQPGRTGRQRARHLAPAPVRLGARSAAIGGHRHHRARGGRGAVGYFVVGARPAAAASHRAVGRGGDCRPDGDRKVLTAAQLARLDARDRAAVAAGTVRAGRRRHPHDSHRPDAHAARTCGARRGDAREGIAWTIGDDAGDAAALGPCLDRRQRSRRATACATRRRCDRDVRSTKVQSVSTR